MEARQNLWKNRRWSGLTSPCRVFTKTHPAVAAECTDWFFFFFLKNPLYLYAPVSALKPDRCEMKCSLSDFTSHTLYFWSVHLNTSSAARVKHLILPSLSLCVVLEQSQHCSLCFVLSWNILEKFWMLKMSVIFTVYLRTFPWSSRHNPYGLKGVFMTHQNDPTVWNIVCSCSKMFLFIVCVCVQNVSCKNCTIATSYQVTLLAICWSGKYWDFGNLC